MNNSRDGITGMLVYRDLDFVQILEGPDAAARELGMSPLASSNSWDHEISMQGVYRRWLALMQRGEERARGACQ